MNNILNYFGLAAAVLSSVSALQAAFHQPTVSGAAIAGAAQPVLMTLPSVLPHLTIPAQLVTEVSEAVAETVNTYFKRSQISGSGPVHA